MNVLKLLSDRDQHDLALLREFKRTVLLRGIGISPETVAHVREAEQRIGTNLRAVTSGYANADPNRSAEADEILRGTTCSAAPA